MTQISLRVDDEVKARAVHACEQMGIPLSTAINIYLVKLGNECRIPFEVSADPFYSESNQNYLRKIAADIKNGTAHFAEHDLIEEN